MLAFEQGKSEEAVRFIRDHFVAVAFDAYIPGNTEEESQFGYDTTRGNNGFSMATASGFRLCNGEKPYHVLGFNSCLPILTQGVDEFRKLPEAQRKPKLDKPKTAVKENKRIPEPPARGLIVTVYTTLLEKNAQGQWTRGRLWYNCGDGKAHTLEPQRDVLWFTEAEWKSLLPPNPKAGDTFPAPEFFKKRIFGYYAQLAWPDGGDEGPDRAGALTFRVEKGSPPGSLGLRLEGFVQKGDWAEAQKFFEKGIGNDGRPARGHGGIDLTFIGRLNYNAKTRAFDRFDVVALGECWGWTSAYHRGNSTFGRYPIGIAFELNRGERPADRIHPKYSPAYAGGSEYFKP